MISTPAEITIPSASGLVPEFTIKVTPHGIAVVFLDENSKPIRVWSRTYNEIYERSETQSPSWL